jgi:hypothetical protein
LRNTDEEKNPEIEMEAFHEIPPKELGSCSDLRALTPAAAGGAGSNVSQEPPWSRKIRAILNFSDRITYLARRGKMKNILDRNQQSGCLDFSVAETMIH